MAYTEWILTPNSSSSATMSSVIVSKLSKALTYKLQAQNMNPRLARAYNTARLWQGDNKYNKSLRFNPIMVTYV